MTRTLPIRVEPIAGESLQSWLTALAHRNDVTWTQILRAVGLHHHSRDTGRCGWTVRLHPHELQGMAEATEIEPAVLQQMTLARFEYVGITLGRKPHLIDMGGIRDYASRSRYCPHCLNDTQGRWQLHWRLGWSFACLTHRCLLAHTCPHCQRPPRRLTPYAAAIPQPCCCEHRLQQQPHVQICGKDLRRSPAVILDGDDAILHAQQCINTIIATGTADLGVYRNAPVAARIALADLKALATRLARQYSGSGDEPGLQGEELCEIDPADDTLGARKVSAMQPALALTDALRVLSAPDVHTAGRHLQTLIETIRRHGRAASATSTATWGISTSKTLTAVQLAAVSPWLSPSDQIRYRVASSKPQRPQRPQLVLARIARAVPALLWPNWAIPMQPNNIEYESVRAALSVATLLVGTRATLGQATQLLGSAITPAAVSRTLVQLRSSGHWTGIQNAVTDLAEHLADQHPVIDYQRRRALDYTNLLPDRQWARICRTTDADTRSTAAPLLRCLLFTELSGGPASAAPWFNRQPAFRRRLAELPSALTPDLHRQLHCTAKEFLEEQHISEPVSAPPPNTVLDSGTLPGPNLDRIRPGAIHRRIQAGSTIRQTAQQLCLRTETVRYILETNPATPRPTNGPRALHQLIRLHDLKNGTAALIRAHPATPPNITELARHAGASRQTLARMANALDTPLNPPGRPRSHRICQREWLQHHYIRDHRTIAEIAALAAVSPTTVRRWARYHHITLRSRGTASHRAHGQLRRAARSYPARIRAALDSPGGHDRLTRFTQAMSYPTLHAAATALSTTQPVLTQQINRLERELGVRLYQRARRGHPMTPTASGIELIKDWTR